MGILLGKNEKKAILSAGFAGGLFLAFKYLFPLLAPLLLAFIVVYPSYPRLKRIQEKTHIRKELLLGGMLVLLAAGLLLGLCRLVSAGTVRAAQIGSQAVAIRGQVDGLVRDCCLFLEERMGMDAVQMQRLLTEGMQEVTEKLQENALPKAAEQSMEYLRGLALGAAFLGISFVLSLLLCRDYEAILQRLGENEWLAGGWQFVEKTIAMVGGYVRAQAVIWLAISGLAAAGLFIGRVEGALWLGLLAGLLDAIPFIGTGLILLPTALWQLLSGNIPGVVLAALTYVLCVMVRQLLEPRLLGKQTGIFPVFMLLAVYAGVRLFGLPGFFLGPLYLVLLREGIRCIGAVCGS